jgi:hypothetical protein
MIRRGWTALIVTAMGLGLFAAYSGVRVHADNAPRITNISVAVDGSGHVSYGMCVVAAAPPSSGTVIVEGPITSTTQVGASFTYNDLSCGHYNGTAYYMRATFSPSLAAGSYTFKAAAVDEPDGSSATLGRDSGFTSNFRGDRVWNSCSVDFNTGTPSPVENCNPPTGGVVGDLTTVIVSGPTPTATKAPTSTPVPTATKAPTRTPVPTATPTQSGNGTPPADTSPPIGTAAPTNTPVPVVVVSTGGAAIATPTATLPSPPTPRPVGPPPTPTVRSWGPALRATVREPLVRPGATQHIAVSYVARALVQANVAFPGVRPFSLRGRTDIHGHLVLPITVPRTIKLSHGRATARVAMSAVSNKGRAQVTRVLRISDMVLRVARGRIVNCMQTATVHVAYHANAPLRVVLLFPHGRHLTLRTRTDRHGNAMVRASVTYVHANSPVRIRVQASDAAPGAQRMESTAVSVVLPKACRKAPAAIVTIGD